MDSSASMPRRRTDVLLRTAVMAVMALGQGCAIGNVGFIASHAVPANGAWVVDSYALGAWLHAVGDGGGLSLGYGRCTEIVPAGRAGDAMEPGWRWGVAHKAKGSPTAVSLASVGLDAHVLAGSYAATVGYSQSTLMVGTRGDSTVGYFLAYDAERPGQTEYRECGGNGEPC